MVKGISLIPGGMGFHTFDVERAGELEKADRYRFCSREELLWWLRPDSSMRVADLGSGTGFYADDVAPHVGVVFAVDMQPEMHAYYQDKGVPENVSLVESTVADLPLEQDSLDAAFSVDTYHEYYSPASLSCLARVLRPGGVVVTVDWSAKGEENAGPPLSERFALSAVIKHFEDAGFRIVEAMERPETFVCVAERN